MKFLHKKCSKLLFVAILLMSSSNIVSAESYESGHKSSGYGISESGDVDHKHFYGPRGKGLRYLKHKTEVDKEAYSKSRNLRRGPPGKTTYKPRKVTE